MDLVYEETLYSRPTPEYKKPKKMRPTKVKQDRTGKFEIYTDKVGEYRFRLKAPNGEIIAVSEGYKKKKACINGIQSVRRNVRNTKIIELS